MNTRLGPVCPLCHGVMETGFLFDRVGQGGIPYQMVWVGGDPRTSWFGSVEIKHRPRLPVVTLRCVACGFLASYAVQPPQAE